MKPLVGIVCREIDDIARPWYPARQGALEAYVDAIEAVGGAAVLVPLVGTSSLKRIYATLDGLLFCGGGDIDPGFYKEETLGELDRPSLKQDTAEMVLASWCVIDRKPVLGVCRGMQIMNIAMGGSLHQDIPSEYKTSINHDESFQNKLFGLAVHPVHLKPDTRIREIIGTDVVSVNSLHHQAVKVVAKGLKISATAPDNVIEAIEGCGDHYFMGAQFHPEWLYQKDKRWLGLFADFVNHLNLQKAEV